MTKILTHDNPKSISIQFEVHKPIKKDGNSGSYCISMCFMYIGIKMCFINIFLAPL